MNLPRTESLAMPEAVPVSGRVRNLKVYGHVNKVSHSHSNGQRFSPLASPSSEIKFNSNLKCEITPQACKRKSNYLSCVIFYGVHHGLNLASALYYHRMVYHHGSASQMSNVLHYILHIFNAI